MAVEGSVPSFTFSPSFDDAAFPLVSCDVTSLNMISFEAAGVYVDPLVGSSNPLPLPLSWYFYPLFLVYGILLRSL